MKKRQMPFAVLLFGGIGVFMVVPIVLAFFRRPPVEVKDLLWRQDGLTCRVSYTVRNHLDSEAAVALQLTALFHPKIGGGRGRSILHFAGQKTVRLSLQPQETTEVKDVIPVLPGVKIAKVEARTRRISNNGVHSTFGNRADAVTKSE